MTQPNPYDSPAPIPNPAKSYTTGSRKLDFGEMFRFVFSSPNWGMNLLWGSLCLLLGGLVVPQIIFSGYLWELVEKKHRGQTAAYPDFDTNRFGDYLMRGVWPFLVQMLLSVVLVVLIIPLMICGVTGMAVGGANENEAVGVLAFIGMWALMMVVMMLFQLAIVPFLLRAGLSQDLGAAFNIGWAKEFVGLMWKELLLGAVVLAGSAIAAYFVGLLLFCIGVYPAMVVWMYANTHFIWQVYEIYLQRGGTPIPLKPEPAKFG